MHLPPPLSTRLAIIHSCSQFSYVGIASRNQSHPLKFDLTLSLLIKTAFTRCRHFFYISSIGNLQYKILTTLLTNYFTILQIQYHEEQDIMSTSWLLEGKEEEKKSKTTYNYTQKENSEEGGLGGCLTDGEKFERIQSNDQFHG